MRALAGLCGLTTCLLWGWQVSSRPAVPHATGFGAATPGGHVSASWAVDEVLSASAAIHDVTIQWSIIAEGLNHSVHSKGAHGYGSLVRAAGGVTLHHNLWAHNESRNPRLGDNYGA